MGQLSAAERATSPPHGIRSIVRIVILGKAEDVQTPLELVEAESTTETSSFLKFASAPRSLGVRRAVLAFAKLRRRSSPTGWALWGQSVRKDGAGNLLPPSNIVDRGR